MANITDNISWDNVYQLEQTDVVLGGAGNISNQQAQQLTNRTAWLKNAMRGFNDFTFVQSSKTLTVDDILQKLVIINGNATSQIYNLPTGLTSGVIVNIMAYNVTKQVTINSQGSNDIVLAGVNRQKLYLGDGESVYLAWTGDHWFVYHYDPKILTVGKISYGYKADANTVIADGRLLNRLDYPRLWEFAQSIGASLIADLGWLNTAGNKGFFSSGDNATTFRVPDLRSMFIRGLDLGAGIDFGRQNENPGGYEADDFKSHNHGMGKEGVGPGPNLVGDAYTEGGNGTYDPPKGTGFTGGGETRPKNIGLLPLINL